MTELMPCTDAEVDELVKCVRISHYICKEVITQANNQTNYKATGVEGIRAYELPVQPLQALIIKEFVLAPLVQPRWDGFWSEFMPMLGLGLHNSCLVMETAHLLHHCIYDPDMLDKVRG